MCWGASSRIIILARLQGYLERFQGTTKNQETSTKQAAANRKSVSGTVVDNRTDKDKIIIKPDWKGLQER